MNEITREQMSETNRRIDQLKELVGIVINHLQTEIGHEIASELSDLLDEI